MLICIEKLEIRELSICIKKSIEISRLDFICFKNIDVYRDKFCAIKIKNEKRDNVDVNFKISTRFSIADACSLY